MIIFIDAYNALRFLFPQDRHSTEAQRTHFLQQLSAYVQAKQHDGVEVRAVFDGGLMHHRHREVHGGVVVMEAGYGRDADSYIVECVARHDHEVLVVTNDRELQRFSADEGAQTMKVAEFWDIVRGVVADEVAPRAQVRGLGAALEKLDSTSEPGNGDMEMYEGVEDLDSLMIEASLGALPVKEDDFENEQQVRNSSGRKLSKKEKRAQKLRKKIR